MKPVLKAAWILFFVVWVPVFSFSMQRRPYLYGRIIREYERTQQNSVPISGMEMRILNAAGPDKEFIPIFTDPYGKFSLFDLPGNGEYGKYIIQIIRDGQVTSKMDILIDNVFIQLDIIINDSNEIINVIYVKKGTELELDESSRIILPGIAGELDNYLDIIKFSNSKAQR